MSSRRINVDATKTNELFGKRLRLLESKGSYRLLQR